MRDDNLLEQGTFTLSRPSRNEDTVTPRTKYVGLKPILTLITIGINIKIHSIGEFKIFLNYFKNYKIKDEGRHKTF